MPLATSSGSSWSRMTVDNVSDARLPMMEQPAPSTAQSAPQQTRRNKFEGARGFTTRARSDFFFDACGLAAEVPEVIELRSAHITTSFHLDLRHGRTVSLKNALYPLPVRDLP